MCGDTHAQASLDHKVQKAVWEKIFAAYVIDKGLILLVQRKKLLQINMVKTNSPIEKWSKDMSRQFREEEIRTVNNQRTVKEIFAAVKYMRLTCIYWLGKMPVTYCWMKKVGYKTAGRLWFHLWKIMRVSSSTSFVQIIEMFSKLHSQKRSIWGEQLPLVTPLRGQRSVASPSVVWGQTPVGITGQQDSPCPIPHSLGWRIPHLSSLIFWLLFLSLQAKWAARLRIICINLKIYFCIIGIFFCDEHILFLNLEGEKKGQKKTQMDYLTDGKLIFFVWRKFLQINNKDNTPTKRKKLPTQKCLVFYVSESEQKILQAFPFHSFIREDCLVPPLFLFFNRHPPNTCVVSGMF